MSKSKRYDEYGLATRFDRHKKAKRKQIWKKKVKIQKNALSIQEMQNAFKGKQLITYFDDQEKKTIKNEEKDNKITEKTENAEKTAEKKEEAK